MNYSYELAPISDFPKKSGVGVVTEHGNIKYEVPDDVEIASVDPVTGKAEWAHPSVFSVHPDTELFLVRFDNSDFSFVSANHSMLVYDDNKLVEKPTKDCVGKYAPYIDKNQPDDIAILNSVVAEGEEGRRGVIGVRGKAMVPVSWEMPLNYQTGLFIGLVLGDGWVDCRDRLFLAGSTDEKKINREIFKRICKSGFLPYANEPKDIDRVSENIAGKMTSRGKTSIMCAWFNRWLKEQIGDGSFAKKIPTFSLNASKEHLLGVLDGLLCTDGSTTLSARQIALKIDTSSVALALGIKALCWRLGIQPTIHPYESELKGTRMFSVGITVGGIRRLLTEFNFECSHASKNQKLVEFKNSALFKLDRNIHAAKYVVPISLTVLDSIEEVLSEDDPVDYGFNKSHIKAAVSKARKTQSFRQDMLLSILDKNRFLYDIKAISEYSRIVLESGIKWVRVDTALFIAYQTAYDLQVDGYGTFGVVSGLVTSNSDGDQLNIHVPATYESKQDVITKMMPSTNLIGPATFSPMYVPSNEAALGLFQLSNESTKKEPKTYSSEEEVFKAYERGELHPGDPVIIK